MRKQWIILVCMLVIPVLASAEFVASSKSKL